MEFVVKVRDIDFWNREDVIIAMSKVLTFMTGDQEYTFCFEGGHSTPIVQLFDSAKHPIPCPNNAKVMLFSGGLDSFAGALETLANDSATACLVSHESQSGTIRTQRGLRDWLRETFPNRVVRFPFRCHLQGIRAPEETQRTRTFLYSSIAFAVSNALKLDDFAIFENGFTSFAFAERLDLLNARASRTTHPKTISLMSEFLSLVNDKPFTIDTPFQRSTKADVLRLIDRHDANTVITSCISCSATMQKKILGRQCGKCSQCIERRLAAYTVGLDEFDEPSNYAFDFIREAITDGEARTVLLDYLRFAVRCAKENESWLETERAYELSDLLDYVQGDDEYAQIQNIWDVCSRHGREVLSALRKIREQFDDPACERPAETILDMIADRDYIRTPVDHLVQKLSYRFKRAIPLGFSSSRPKHENELNDLIEAVLSADSEEYAREFPVIMFGTAKTVPDHSTSRLDLFIEVKYLRETTSRSKITDQIASDIIKYGRHRHILFVIYDPARRIKDDLKFQAASEQNGSCTVCMVR